MAQTYTVAAQGISFALNKCMLGIFNGVGSGRIIRIYRVLLLNNQTVAVTGVLTTMELRRTTAGSGGTTLTPVKHDSTNETPPAQLAVATNQTVTTSDLFRRFIWSNDEAVANAAATLDELETLPSLNYIWDVGYDDANVEPIVLREGQGFAIVNTGNTSVGNVDLFIEFTLASV